MTTTTEYPFRVACAHCATIIESANPAILTGIHFCALCEVEALFTDADRAWAWDALDAFNHPEDDGYFL